MTLGYVSGYVLVKKKKKLIGHFHHLLAVWIEVCYLVSQNFNLFINKMGVTVASNYCIKERNSCETQERGLP